MFEFFMGEVRAYSIAASAAASALGRGDPEAARGARGIAEVGCETLERYLRNRFFRNQLTDDQYKEVKSAVASLRASLVSVDQRMTSTST